MDDFKLYRGVSVVTGDVIEGELFKSGSNVFIADVHVYEVEPDSVEKFIPTGDGGRWESLIEP